MADYLTFKEIKEAVSRAIKDPQQRMGEVIGEMVNMVYLTEILQADDLYPLHWLHTPIHTKFHATKIITDISQSDPAVVTSPAHGFLGGEVIAIWDAGGMTEINFGYERLDNLRLYVVDSVFADTFTIVDIWGSNIDSTGYTAYTSSGTIFHHGWLVVGGASSMIRRITDIGRHESTPLVSMSWEELLRSPDHYISNSSGSVDRYINFQTFDGDGNAYNYAFTFPGAQEDDQGYVMIEAGGAKLELDADVPLLPTQYHFLLVSGTVMRMKETGIDVATPQLWPAIYSQQIQSMVTKNRQWWRQHEEQKNSIPYGLV
jgi:hypothetical protein